MKKNQTQVKLKLLENELNNRLSNKKWHSIARPSQLPPEGDWLTWLILAGRGFGKTRTGAQTVYHWARSGQFKRIALIGKSRFETQAVMLNGESGLLNIQDNGYQGRYIKGESRIEWPNGAQAHLLGGDFSEALRGHQFDCAWVDELAKFKNPEELWRQLMFCLRLGKSPRCIVTTTPRPSPFLKTLTMCGSTEITTGSSYENEKNLSPDFFKKVIRSYEGTKFGQQEIEGILLEDREGALWRQSMFKYGDERKAQFIRKVLAIDPAVYTAPHD